MVKIIKDNVRKEVTKGAYENFYKPLGYEIEKTFKEVVEEKPKITKNDRTEYKNDKIEDENTYKKR